MLRFAYSLHYHPVVHVCTVLRQLQHAIRRSDETSLLCQLVSSTLHLVLYVLRQTYPSLKKTTKKMVKI